MTAIQQAEQVIKLFRITKDDFKTVEYQRRLAYVDGLLDAGECDAETEWQKAQQAENVRRFALSVSHQIGSLVLQTMVGVMDRFNNEVAMYQNDVYKHFFRIVRDQLFEDSCCIPFLLVIRHQGAEIVFFPKKMKADSKTVTAKYEEIRQKLSDKTFWVGFTDGFEFWETEERTIEPVMAFVEGHCPWAIPWKPALI